MLPSTERFSDRVDNYVRYRPSYPTALIDVLRERALSGPAPRTDSAIADIGSGTGIFTTLLLPLAARVYAVEPNAEMRAAAEQRLSGASGFVSVAATAEATTLPDASVDLVTAAQAFHWFDPIACRREFARILKPGGRIALIWNQRIVGGTPFLADYEKLLFQHIAEHRKTRQSDFSPAHIAAFFEPARFETIEAPNEQHFDLPGLIGRTLSSSYAPNPGQPGHDVFVAELQRIFQQHARDDRVTLRYQTRLYLGVPHHA
ncbi:class I SAM-dependent methyltransferase [Geminisphaera colitermitum]|uniref:class I SAM-dependent methyltransferase n=1 Tax=Geminisphaera colitermitum TaxID=1148786 RepID=UPI000158C563|nr:class I SAM-dependent methyltransferase [Geminisphaera colitermitum]